MAPNDILPPRANLRSKQTLGLGRSRSLRKEKDILLHIKQLLILVEYGSRVHHRQTQGTDLGLCGRGTHTRAGFQAPGLMGVSWVDSGLFSRRSFVRNGQFFCFAVLKQKNARCWPPRPGNRPDDGARRTIIPGLGGSWRLNGRGPAGVRRRPERSQRLLVERSRVCGLSHTATLQGIMARCRNRDCTRRHFNNMKRL